MRNVIFHKNVLWACSLLTSFCFASLSAWSEPCERIVSLAPSVTEVLFAEHLGAHVVGVTRYCRYPKEVQDIKSVGGFLDPNLEVIVSLKPSHVFVLSEQDALREKLSRLDIPVTVLNHKSVDGILASFGKVAEVCGTKAAAEELSSSISSELHQIELKTKPLRRIRTMIAMGADAADGILKNVYISGRDGFYDQLLLYAGGENVATAGTLNLPGISGEGVAALNPDVIIQLLMPGETSEQNKADALKAWNTMASLQAVRDHKVFIIGDDFATIPGPRLVLLAKKIAHILHPEIF